MLGARDEAAEFDEMDSGTPAEMFNDDPRFDLQYKPRLLTVPYFSVGFSRLVHFDRTPVILVCKGERNLGRVSKLPRGP